jgi:hypothetical protein
MSRFGFFPLIFHWMLDFNLAPRLRFASTQEQSTQTTFSPHFWLALAGFLAVQLMHNHLQRNGLNLIVRLKFQIA